MVGASRNLVEPLVLGAGVRQLSPEDAEMTEPTDRTVESIRTAHLQTVDATRVVAAQALTTAAWALYAAAAAVLLLMIVDYVGTAMKTGASDWPGGLWFAVGPLAAAAVTLHFGAARLARSSAT